jgi:hypothetical protein
MSQVNLPMNPLVEKRLQVSAAGATVPLSGYLGPAPQEGYIRLYQDLSLGSYVELRRDDIVDVEEAESDKEPTLIHAKRDASVKVHRSVATTAASFSTVRQGGLDGVGIVDDPTHGLRPKCHVAPIYMPVARTDNVGHIHWDWVVVGYTLVCD